LHRRGVGRLVEAGNAQCWSRDHGCSNDPEIIAKSYWPDAILLGTVSPVISEGAAAIVTYLTPTKGTGNKNAIDEWRIAHHHSSPHVLPKN
jgi:hypothetical protein